MLARVAPPVAMGCGGSNIKINVEEVIAQFEVTAPSIRGKVWLGLKDDTTRLMQVAGKKTSMDVVDETAKSLLFRMNGARKQYKGECPLEFFDAAGGLVAMRSEKKEAKEMNKKNKETYFWLMWSARPAVEGHKSTYSHVGTPLYLWGMLRNYGLMLDYIEVEGDKDPNLENLMVASDGTAALVMMHEGPAHVIYGPGTEAATEKWRGGGYGEKNKTWLRGKPLAVITKPCQPLKVTMAANADAILLFAMAHCSEWVKVWKATGTDGAFSDC